MTLKEREDAGPLGLLVKLKRCMCHGVLSRKSSACIHLSQSPFLQIPCCRPATSIMARKE
jgi:hypothetical protein